MPTVRFKQAGFANSFVHWGFWRHQSNTSITHWAGGRLYIQRQPYWALVTPWGDDVDSTGHKAQLEVAALLTTGGEKSIAAFFARTNGAVGTGLA